MQNHTENIMNFKLSDITQIYNQYMRGIQKQNRKQKPILV